jgi:tetratricopeptide (TPR) repeat protein
MKKLTYLLVFIAVACMLCVCGGDPAEKNVYHLEKLYSEALRAEKKVAEIKPELATADDFKHVVALYRKVVDEFIAIYPDHAETAEPEKTELQAAHWAGLSLLQIGNLNILSGDTAASKASFADFELLFPHNHDQQRLAWLALAEIFNQEKNAEKTEQIYLKLLEKFDPPANLQLNPFMDVLKLPFDMMRFRDARGDKEKTEYYTTYSIDYYTRLKEKYPQTNLGLAATRFLAETYKFKGRGQEAVALLQTVTDSTGQVSVPAMMLIAEAYFENLGQPDKALEYYQKVLDRGLDTTYTPDATMKMGQVLLMERRFPEAREKFKTILDSFNFAVQYFPQAQRFIAISYEEEDNYEQALDAYLTVIETYATHSLAFETYLYLPKFFTKQNKKQLRDQWYNRAEDFFKNTRDDYKNRNLGAAAQEYLCRLYMTYEDWDPAIQELDNLAVQFPEYTFASEAYFRIAAIYEMRLNLPDSAKYYYGKQLELYPDAPVSKAAKEKINNL